MITLTYRDGSQQKYNDIDAAVSRLTAVYKAQPLALEGLTGIITDGENRAVRFINDILVEQRKRGSKLPDSAIQQIDQRLRTELADGNRP